MHQELLALGPAHPVRGPGALRENLLLRLQGVLLLRRVDDVINVSGHRIGTAEVESALVLHDSCAEAAVVGYEHPIKGQGIYAYVTLMEGKEYSDGLKKELVQVVRAKIGGCHPLGARAPKDS